MTGVQTCALPICGSNNLFGTNDAVLRTHLSRLPRQRPSVLINGKPLGNDGEKFQWMELGLPGYAHRSGGGKGQGRALGELHRDTSPLHGRDFRFQHRLVIQGVDPISLFLKITAGFLGHEAIPLHSVLIGLPVKLCGLGAESLNQFMINQPVLGGDFGGGTAGSAAADASGFYQGAVHIRLPQQIGAQDPEPSIY